jgi:hypothetical protein
MVRQIHKSAKHQTQPHNYVAKLSYLDRVVSWLYQIKTYSQSKNQFVGVNMMIKHIVI